MSWLSRVMNAGGSRPYTVSQDLEQRCYCDLCGDSVDETYGEVRHAKGNADNLRRAGCMHLPKHDGHACDECLATHLCTELG